MSVPKQSFGFPSSAAQKKKHQSLASSQNRISTASIQKLTNPSAEACLFCNKKDAANKKNYFPLMINKALYSKYSSSQNYYYTKDINDILTNSRTPVVIKYKDFLTIDEEEDFLKRFYKASEYDYKIKMLTEYYKFHKDISRLFMQPTTNVLNKYHDKKRRLEYIRVTKMLREENEVKNPSPKPKEKPRTEEKVHVIMDRILDNLKLNDDNEQSKSSGPAQKSNNLRPGTRSKSSSQKPVISGLNLKKALVSNTEGNNENFYVGYSKSDFLKKKAQDQAPMHRCDQINPSNNHSISNTIQDLNMKLGEIISNNSRNYGNYFENSAAGNTNNFTNDPFLNETITNLDNFLTFLKKNPQQQKINEIPEIIATDRQYHRHSNTLSDLQFKNMGFQYSSVPTTYRGYEIEGPMLVQQVTSHARTNSQSGSRTKGTTTIDHARNPYSSSGRVPTYVQQNNFVNSGGYNDVAGSVFKKNRLHADRSQTSLGLMNSKSKTGNNNLVSKIKNFDEALKHNEQLAGLKIYSSQNSQRSLSRESKRGSASNQNYNSSRKSSISKTPRTIESGLREPSISKNVNTDHGPTKPRSVPKSTSKLNLKQIESTLRSSLGSTQSSSKFTTKVEYIIGTGNSSTGQNNTINSARGVSVGGNSHSEKLVQKSHTRGYSGNVENLINNNGTKEQTGLAGARLAASLTSQNFFGHSRSQSNFTSNGQATTHTLRDLKSKGTYFEQKRPPSGLTGSLSKRDLQKPSNYNEANRLATQNYSKGDVERFNHNYGEPLMTEDLNSAKPVSSHKHTKSEPKYNKMENQKGSEVGFRMKDPLLNRNLFQDSQSKARASGNKPSYGNLDSQNTSPSKPIYTYNQNNIVNIFLHPNQDVQKDPNIVIKAEIDRFSKNNRNLDSAQYDFTVSSKVTPKKLSPNGTQFVNSQLNSHRAISSNPRNESSNTPPLKGTRKEDMKNAQTTKQIGTRPVMSLTATNFFNRLDKK